MTTHTSTNTHDNLMGSRTYPGIAAAIADQWGAA